MSSKTTGEKRGLAEMLNDASIDRVMAIGADWSIIAWNCTSENTTGLKKDDILGRQLLDVFPEIRLDEAMLRAIEAAKNGLTSFLPSKDGVFNRHFYENHFIPLRDGQGNIFGVMNIMHDVAHRIKAELELKRLNAELRDKYTELEIANAELATFTSITGSDLKEPIQKIYTALEYVMKNEAGRLSDSSKGNMRRIQASVNRINLLLDDILKLATARGFSSDLGKVDLNEIVQGVRAGLREKLKDTQTKIFVEALPFVTGSGQMIYQLFQNLMLNSIKFQPADRTPVINFYAIRQSREQKEWDVVHVSDNGIGFEQTDSEKIFQMFEKLNNEKRYPGSGIGLTICQKIMHAHGGHIEAVGVPGEGSIFKCYFPVSPQEVP